MLVKFPVTAEYESHATSEQVTVQKCTEYLQYLNANLEQSRCLFAVPHLGSFHSLYLLLQLKNTIEQCFSRWWTARYIYVHWDNTITSTNNWVWVVIISTTIRTASHGNDPFRVICLIINSAQCWSHFVGYCTGNNETVGLTRACPKDHSKPIHVIPDTNANDLQVINNYYHIHKWQQVKQSTSVINGRANCKQQLSSSWDGWPFGHNRHGLKRGKGCCAPFGGSLSNTMWPGLRPTSMPSCILIHPTVWPQYTNVTDRQTHRTYRQWTDGTGQTVLQTVAQKNVWQLTWVLVYSTLMTR